MISVAHGALFVYTAALTGEYFRTRPIKYGNDASLIEESPACITVSYKLLFDNILVKFSRVIRAGDLESRAKLSHIKIERAIRFYIDRLFYSDFLEIFEVCIKRLINKLHSIGEIYFVALSFGE